ncbi:MAG TPA: hydroxyacid dehydrogenase [Opitutaceae bacterium]|nr:hydroxyacid dehydrogenase [Opitutaceae bacterium]
MNVAFFLAADAFEQIYGDECFRAASELGRVLGPPLTDPELSSNPPPWLDQVEAIFTGWGGPRLDRALLRRMPKLKVAFYGAGSLRAVLTDESWDSGIVFANAAALNAVPTAEFAFGSILLSLKRAWQQAAQVRARRAYPKSLAEVSKYLPGGYGSTVGLVSLGLVGRRVAQWLANTDVNVVAYDPFAKADELASLKVRRVSLDELFATADVISLHTPLLPETTGMIGQKLLSSMKTGATLINTSRGAVVREDEMIATLRARPDLQAIVDVTDPEPPSPDSPLFDLPNVFLTPHIAGSLGPECRRMGRAMIEEFQRFLRGQPLAYEIRREHLARTA